MVYLRISAFVLLLAGLLACEVPAGAPMFTLDTLVFQLTGVRSKSEAEAAAVLMKMPSSPGPQVVATLETEWAKIKRENRVYGHYLEDRNVRIAIECATHCGCIAGDLGKSVATQARVFQIWFTGGGAIMGIDARPMTHSATIHWDYHVVTVLADDQGSVSVVDPLIVGSARPIRFADWWPRFAHHTPMQFRVSAVVPSPEKP